MGIVSGTVVVGKVVVDGVNLPEGSRVIVLTPDPAGEVQLMPAEEAELLEAMAEADRGETISVEEF